MIDSGLQSADITFIVVTDTNDAGGGGTSVNSVYWNTRAKIKQLSSVKTLQAQQDKLINGFVFSVRYRKDKSITDNMFIDYKGGRYVINSIENIGMNNTELKIVGMFSQLKTEVPGQPGNQSFTYTLPFTLS